MNLFSKKSRILLIVAGMIFSNCSRSNSFSTSFNAAADNGDTGSIRSQVVGGAVTKLLTSGSGNVSVDSTISGDENAILVVAGGDNSGSTQGYQIGSSSSASLMRSLVEEPSADTAETDPTELFHNDLREAESNLDPTAFLDGQGGSARYLSTESQSVGDTRSFKVINAFSSGSTTYDTVTAVLAVQHDGFDIYMDTRDWEEQPLTDDDLNSLADQFDTAIPQEREIFGAESDVNGDNKFTILITREVNALGENYGGLITGFFYAIDLSDSSTYSQSNEMEIFYTMVPDPTGKYGSAVSHSMAMENILPGVLVHEFQHLISFNQHYYLNGVTSEEPWLNEAMSHLAEDIFSADNDGFMTTTGPENPSRISYYLNDVNETCFTCGATLVQRGGSYLFLRYLYERAEAGDFDAVSNGNELLSRLETGTYRGVSNVKDSLFGDINADSDLIDTLGHFGVALYLSGTGLTTDPTYEISGLDLRGIQDDNRGTYLSGPAVISMTGTSYVGTIQGYGLNFIEVPGTVVAANGGSVPLSFPSGSNFSAYWIQP